MSPAKREQSLMLQLLQLYLSTQSCSVRCGEIEECAMTTFRAGVTEFRVILMRSTELTCVPSAYKHKVHCISKSFLIILGVEGISV